MFRFFPNFCKLVSGFLAATWCFEVFLLILNKVFDYYKITKECWGLRSVASLQVRKQKQINVLRTSLLLLIRKSFIESWASSTENWRGSEFHNILLVFLPKQQSKLRTSSLLEFVSETVLKFSTLIRFRFLWVGRQLYVWFQIIMSKSL